MTGKIRKLGIGCFYEASSAQFGTCGTMGQAGLWGLVEGMEMLDVASGRVRRGELRLGLELWDIKDAGRPEKMGADGGNGFIDFGFRRMGR